MKKFGYFLIVVSGFWKQHIYHDFKLVLLDTVLLIGVWMVVLSIMEDK